MISPSDPKTRSPHAMVPGRTFFLHGVSNVQQNVIERANWELSILSTIRASPFRPDLRRVSPSVDGGPFKPVVGLSGAVSLATNYPTQAKEASVGHSEP